MEEFKWVQTPKTCKACGYWDAKQKRCVLVDVQKKPCPHHR